MRKMEIEQFDFSEAGRSQVASLQKGTNWPVVYLISNDEELYVGETTSAAYRMGQHLANPEKQRHNLSTFRIVFDDTYNKSVILDFEQRLIKCFRADGKYSIINANAGQSASHEYYDRKGYSDSFSELWATLVNKKIAQNPLSTLENREIFKYSPYNSLTPEQDGICTDILNDICDKLEESNGQGRGISLINGCAGTGKTVLAISIINSLMCASNLDESELTDEDLESPKFDALKRLRDYLNSSSGHPLKIGLVFPMTGIRGTIKKVFEDCSCLDSKMIMSPFDVKKDYYDVLIVDEAHRLTQRKNIQNYKAFDNTCVALGFDKNTATQLDWILKQGKNVILFYDEDQSIKGADITYSQFHDTIEHSGMPINNFLLSTQMRCAGGDTYIKYLKDIIECRADTFREIQNYEFRIFDDVDDMIRIIKSLDRTEGLCRNVAGYSWKWVTQPDHKPADDMSCLNEIVRSGRYDIDIKGYHYIWNLTTDGWLARQDSIETIGCIHTTQGFDLNYIGVIFGEEIDYDPETNSITVDASKFYDKKVKAGCPEEIVKRYIINTYTTMMARGIRGCYVYACNENLKTYLKRFIRVYK